MFCSATILGRVGKKDTSTLKNGSELTMISVATSKKFKDSQGTPKEVTTWHRVNCFGKVQEIANKYVQVGDTVFVRGEINHTQIEHGEKAGQWSYNVNASDIRFIPKGKKEGQEETSTRQHSTSNNQKNHFEFEDDGIAF
jgi:single-strand DNA-binding protein